MLELGDHFEEEYLYLADVTHDAALIAWGKFFFNGKMKRIKDNNLHLLEGHQKRRTSIGANCESYGRVRVEVLNAGAVVRSVETEDTYAWVSGLAADTDYTYRVHSLNEGVERRWADDELHSYNPEIEELVKDRPERVYSCRFRTFPEPGAHERLVFAVIGDTGTAKDSQYKVARALDQAVTDLGVRLVIMVGDTIYAKESGGSGDDDFEWLTTYFQPYRTIIDRVPFYPCVGNHDTREGFEGLLLGEKQQDRLALYDNLLVMPRFVSQIPPSREASITPGLFYRFGFGAGVEFICLDTSKETDVSSHRLFEFGKHKDWVGRVLGDPLGTPKWRIPFSHHPPYCKGPRHDEDETELRHSVIPLCEANGVRTYFSGHEHNFQCIDSPNRKVRCFVSGGAGKFSDGRPKKSTDGFMHLWGGNDRGHFLIVTISGDQMTVEPRDWEGNALPLFKIEGGDPQPSSTITV